MVHYWKVTEMEQRVLIDVAAGPAVITAPIEYKMAAEHQHGSDCQEQMIHI